MRPISIFGRDFDRGYLRLLAKGVAQSYQRAEDVTGSLYTDPEIRFNTCPWIRRGFMEQMLLDSAKGHGRIQAAQVLPVGFWRHVEVSSGQSTMTQLSFDPSQIAPRAAYREALAMFQRNLFGGDADEVDDDSRVYAVLMHQRLLGSPGKVGIAYIRCARKGARRWYDGGVNLLHEFPEEFGFSATDKEVEQIDDDAWPEPLDDQETG